MVNRPKPSPYNKYKADTKDIEWTPRTQAGETVDLSSLPDGVELHPTGLTMPDDLEFDQWQEIGPALVKMNDGVQFGLGDWWAKGEYSYGERAKFVKETAEKLPYDFKSLMQLGYVARRVDPSLRNEHLWWSHHKEVAPLKPEDQKKWLDKAVRHKWTVREFREKLHDREVIHMARNPDDPGHEKAAQYWGEDFLAEAKRSSRKLFPRWDDARLDRVAEKTLAELVNAAKGAAVFWAETASQLVQYQQTRLAAGKGFKPRVPDRVDQKHVQRVIDFETGVGGVIDPEPEEKPRKSETTRRPIKRERLPESTKKAKKRAGDKKAA